MDARSHAPKPTGAELVFTNKARCRDCHRCLRACPVKAIRVHDGQAQVVAERCIACGTCIRECPQGAKSFRRDLDGARALVARGGPLAASIAPSFAAVFDPWQRRRLPSALRRLGFSYVGETAIGAYHVARETAEYVAAAPDRAHICSACPVAVTYVEKYAPDLVDLLVPVVSPMLAHAQHIKDTQGADTPVVFIGPCIGKKGEAEWEATAGRVDCVITFGELMEWLEQERIDLATCEESDFDEQPAGDARLFPIEGGTLRTAAMSTDVLSAEVVAVSGPEEFTAVLDSLRRDPRPVVVEPLFCNEGCINGPAMPDCGNVFGRRQQVLDYSQSHQGEPPTSGADRSSLGTRFAPAAIDADSQFTEEQIREVLAMTGKSDPADQLNCGACGYSSCREKAIAVLRGLAEPEMCIPYMRRLAEQRTDRIIETTPNGIVILDEHMNILSINPAFARLFMCSEAVLGKPIGYLMDPDPFEKLATGAEDQIDAVVAHPNYNLVCHQALYALREERQYVGVFVDITRSRSDRKKLDQLRAETMTKAQELLDHQLAMAQQLTRFLGEGSARGEELLRNLMTLVDQGEDAPAKPARNWLWDTPTSK